MSDERDGMSKTTLWFAVIVTPKTTFPTDADATGHALEAQLQEDWIGGQAGGAAIERVEYVPKDQARFYLDGQP